MNKIFFCSVYCCCTVFFNGCTNLWMEDLVGHLIPNNYKDEYNIGGIGPGGGRVFYCDPTGFVMIDTGEICHYLEAAPNNVPASTSGLFWASIPMENFFMQTETYIGAGRYNTAFILDKDPDAPAAKACKDYNGGGKNDWFLPSLDELYKILENKEIIDDLTGGFTNNFWSSSQHPAADNLAWFVSFFGDLDAASKPNGYYVRPIRAF